MSLKKPRFEAVPTQDPGRNGDKQPETDPNFMCGFLGYRPAWLQRFAKAYYFLICYSLFGIFQGALKAYLNGCVSTIERKFGLTAKAVGIILIADNISALFASLLIGYYATKISRPKIIAFGVWVSVLGCFFSVLPYLIYGPGFVSHRRHVSTANAYARLVRGMSGSRSELKFCTEVEHDIDDGYRFAKDETPAPTSVVAVSLLFLANFLNGIGGTAFYISRATYTDDNVKKKDSPLYFSLIMALRLVCPMLGYVSASVFLAIYESPFDFKTSVKRLSKNPVLMWEMATLIFIINAIGGYVSMFPKYVENQYRVSVSKASLFTESSFGVAKSAVIIVSVVQGIDRVTEDGSVMHAGPTKGLAMMVGLFLGGMIIRLWKPRARTSGLLGAFADLINILGLFAGIFLGCSGWQLAGTNVGSDGRLSLDNPCNEHCDCPATRFQPICHVTTSTTYFSPCAAGCIDRGNGTMACSCLLGNSTGGLDSQLPKIRNGFCDFPCQNLFILVLIVSLGKLISQLSRVGSTLITLRCVDPADKGMALGMLVSCLNFLGAVPYPLIYTAIFDATCLVWEDRGGHRGNCSFYDADKLRVAFHAVTIVFMSLGLVCQLIMSYYAKRVKDMYGEADGHSDHGDLSKPENEALERNEINSIDSAETAHKSPRVRMNVSPGCASHVFRRENSAES